MIKNYDKGGQLSENPEDTAAVGIKEIERTEVSIDFVAEYIKEIDELYLHWGLSQTDDTKWG